MSLSRKLIEKLITEEIDSISSTDFGASKEGKDSLKRLINQLFLEQVSSVDNTSAKSAMIDKIDQYYGVLSDGGVSN